MVDLILSRLVNLREVARIVAPAGFEQLLDPDDAPVFFREEMLLPVPHSRQAARNLTIVYETSHMMREPRAGNQGKASLWRVCLVAPIPHTVPTAWEVHLSWSSIHQSREDAPKPTCSFPILLRSSRHEDHDLAFCELDGTRPIKIFERFKLLSRQHVAA